MKQFLTLWAVAAFFTVDVSKAQGIDSYFLKFSGLRALFPGYPAGVDSVFIDAKNAYLFVGNYSQGLPVEAQLTYFLTHDKRKVLAYRTFREGGDGNSEYYTFFCVDYGSHWADETDQICPVVLLNEFADRAGIRVSPELTECYHLDYLLPQRGTTLMAVLRPVDDVDKGFSDGLRDEFERTLDKLTSIRIPLYWNRDQGIFERGKP